MAQLITTVIPGENESHDPMKWQNAADTLRDAGQDDIAKICHDTARELFRDANENDGGVVTNKS